MRRIDELCHVLSVEDLAHLFDGAVDDLLVNANMRGDFFRLKSFG